MSIDFGALSLRVAPGFVLKGDTQTQSDGIHTAVLKWGDMVPQKPPDPNGAR